MSLNPLLKIVENKGLAPSPAVKPKPAPKPKPTSFVSDVVDKASGSSPAKRRVTHGTVENDEAFAERVFARGSKQLKMFTDVMRLIRADQNLTGARGDKARERAIKAIQEGKTDGIRSYIAARTAQVDERARRNDRQRDIEIAKQDGVSQSEIDQSLESEQQLSRFFAKGQPGVATDSDLGLFLRSASAVVNQPASIARVLATGDDRQSSELGAAGGLEELLNFAGGIALTGGASRAGSLAAGLAARSTAGGIRGAIAKAGSIGVGSAATAGQAASRGSQISRAFITSLATDVPAVAIAVKDAGGIDKFADGMAKSIGAGFAPGASPAELVNSVAMTLTAVVGGAALGARGLQKVRTKLRGVAPEEILSRAEEISAIRDPEGRASAVEDLAKEFNVSREDIEIARGIQLEGRPRKQNTVADKPTTATKTAPTVAPKVIKPAKPKASKKQPRVFTVEPPARKTESIEPKVNAPKVAEAAAKAAETTPVAKPAPKPVAEPKGPKAPKVADAAAVSATKAENVAKADAGDVAVVSGYDPGTVATRATLETHNGSKAVIEYRNANVTPAGVDGSPVPGKVYERDGVTLVVHKNGRNGPRPYTVSEITTGKEVATGTTEAGAILWADVALKDMGADAVKRAIEAQAPPRATRRLAEPEDARVIRESAQSQPEAKVTRTSADAVADLKQAAQDFKNAGGVKGVRPKGGKRGGFIYLPQLSPAQMDALTRIAKASIEVVGLKRKEVVESILKAIGGRSPMHVGMANEIFTKLEAEGRSRPKSLSEVIDAPKLTRNQAQAQETAKPVADGKPVFQSAQDPADRLRAELGIAPVSRGGRKLPDVVESPKTKEVAEQGAAFARNWQANPRPISAEETVGMAAAIVDSQAALKAAQLKHQELVEAGNIDEAVRVAEEVDRHLGDLADLTFAVTKTGSEWGMSGLARQMELRRGGTKESLMFRLNRAKRGTKATSKEIDTALKIGQKFEDIEAEVQRRVNQIMKDKIDIPRRLGRTTGTRFPGVKKTVFSEEMFQSAITKGCK